MHRQFLITTLIALLLTCRCYAAPIPNPPLDVTPDPVQPDPDSEEGQNLNKINRATAQANVHILKMGHVLKTPDNAEHKAIIQAAFGPPSAHNIDVIKTTVDKLKTGIVPVKLETAVMADKTSMGFTTYDSSKDPMEEKQIQFTQKYYSGGIDARVGTLIHEATHYLAHTGDYINDDHKMIAGNLHQVSESTAYAGGNKPKITPKSLDLDINWKKMRDGYTLPDGTVVPGTTDLHLNAESYAQFGAMASEAVKDRDVGISSKRPAPADGSQQTGGILNLPPPPPPPPPAPKKGASAKKGVAKNAPPSNPPQDNQLNKKQKKPTP